MKSVEKSVAAKFQNRQQLWKTKVESDMTKTAMSASILAIVVLVTLADRNLMTRVAPESISLASVAAGSRGIASVVEAPALPESFAAENRALVRDLASRDLGPKASIGHGPSHIEKLAFGYLEGKYSVRLQAGKIVGIEFSESNVADAKQIENLSWFLDSQRELLPDYTEKVHVGATREGSETLESYQLLKGGSVPVANVQFRLDGDGHLLAMQVAQLQVVAK